MLNLFAGKWCPWQRKNSKHNWWEKFKNLLLLATVISFSANLFFKLSLSEAYINGLLVDYLIPKIYLFDCLLILDLIIFYFLEKNYQILKKIKLKFKKIDILIIIFLIFFLIKQISQLNLNLIVFYLRLFLIGAFIYSLFLNKQRQKIVKSALLLTVIWQSFLAYFQFFNQRSLAPYYFFGESHLQHFAAISRGQFFDIEKILPYGSTAHPNILAGLILIFSMLSVLNIFSQKKKKFFAYLILLNAFTIGLLTQSLSALLSLILFLLVLLNKKIQSKKALQRNSWQQYQNIILVFFFIASPLIIQRFNLISQNNVLSISRRAVLNRAAWQMFLDKKIFGQGIFHFVQELENYSRRYVAVRFVQPVHHLGLLVLSEGGLLALGILAVLGWKWRQKINWDQLLILTPIISLDHYLITQPLGLFALCLFIFFTRRQ
jgi:hypothetical protein